MVVKLRSYQSECIEICLSKLRQGIKRQAVSLPVGSGKTVFPFCADWETVFASMIPRIPSDKKTLILAHRSELLLQAFETVKRINPSMNVTLDHGIHNMGYKDADVIVSSVQTLGRTDTKRLSVYDPSDFKYEAHHAPASTYMRILQHMNALSDDSDLFVWGCSATLRRNDNLPLKSVFSEISYRKELIDLIREKYLVNFSVFSVETSIGLDGVASQMGDFVLPQLAARVDNPIRNKLVVQAYLNKVAASGRDATIVFAVNIQHIHSLVEEFKRNGITAAPVHSELSMTERRHVQEEFKAGNIKVLVNCSILTEGVDIPRVDSILLARPTKSSILLQQMLGRGLRLYPGIWSSSYVKGKNECLVVDFVDSMKRSSGLLTTPTLLGLHPEFLVEGLDALTLSSKISKIPDLELFKAKKSDDLDEIVASISDPSSKAGLECRLKPFEAPFESRTIDEDNAIIDTFSPFKFIRIGKSMFACPLDFQRTILIQKFNGILMTNSASQFVIYLRLPTKTEYVFRKQKLANAASLEEAFRFSDDWIRKRCSERTQKIIRKDAKWRLKPPTRKQTEFLNKKFGVVQRGTDGESYHEYSAEMRLHNLFVKQKNGIMPLKRGTASELLNRIFLGAHGQAQKHAKEKKQLESIKEMLDYVNRSTLE